LPALTNPNLYSIADQLIVTGFGSLLGKGGVWVRSYDTAGKQSQSESSEALPSASYEQFFRGSLLDSRMVAGRLILVLQDDAQKIDRNGQGPQNPVEPSCDSFIKTPFNQAQTSYTRIVILDTQSGNLLSEVSVPGALGNQIYVSKSQIVVAGNPAISPYWIRPDDRQTQKVTRDLRQRIGQKLQLVAIDYESSGEITAVALGTVAGRLKPFGAAWSLKTIENGDQRLLSVFTTTGSVRAEDNLGEADNHLYILAREGRELTEVANIPSIAKTEDIRSVRYEGDYAYVVTFKRTDPLFAISLKDPLAPVIEGELKIPGFSMYMHPTGEGQMVGLGYHTEEQKDRDGAFFQGIQLSAFDVSDPENMVRTDNLIMGMRGSYSEATQDHHAFYYDQSDHVLALPLTTFNDELGMINGEQNQSQEDSLYVDDQLANQARIHFRRQFSGAVFFRVGTQTFTELARVSHFSLLRGRCQNSFTPLFWTSQLPPQPDIRRVFKGDGKIYAISNYGIEQLAGDTFVSETIVKTGFGDCQRGGFQGGFE
jgi:inhibitor of cysteine peptidase